MLGVVDNIVGISGDDVDISGIGNDARIDDNVEDLDVVIVESDDAALDGISSDVAIESIWLEVVGDLNISFSRVFVPTGISAISTFFIDGLAMIWTFQILKIMNYESCALQETEINIWYM